MTLLMLLEQYYDICQRLPARADRALPFTHEQFLIKSIKALLYSEKPGMT